MRYAILAVALLFLVSPAHAQSAKTKSFVQKAAAGDLFEIESGKLAASTSKSEAVRGFAQLMVTDHQKTSEELKTRLPKGVGLPAGMGARNQAKIARLKLTRPGSFDRFYADYQVAAHKEAVKLFAGYAKSGDDVALKQWAASTQPVLREHLTMAVRLSRSGGKSGK
jgi:putative membrane protein